MKLEDQVCSLEHAKKLKELGVKQESYFYWTDVVDGFGVKPELRFNQKRVVPDDKSGQYSHKNPATAWEEHYYAAFTVAEFGEILPKILKDGKKGREFDGLELVWKHDTIGYGHYQFECLYHGIDIPETMTEADARAKMLIYLIENNLITI